MRYKLNQFSKIIILIVIAGVFSGCAMANKAKSGFSDVANLDDNKYEVIYYSGYLSSRQQIRDDWNVAAKQACNGGNYTALSGPDVENIKGMDRIVGTISCK